MKEIMVSLNQLKMKLDKNNRVLPQFCILFLNLMMIRMIDSYRAMQCKSKPQAKWPIPLCEMQKILSKNITSEVGRMSRSSLKQILDSDKIRSPYCPFVLASAFPARVNFS